MHTAVDLNLIQHAVLFSRNDEIDDSETVMFLPELLPNGKPKM